MKFTITGKNIIELRKEYGTGNGGFYPQSWYDNEAFANDKPEAGEYEINFGENTKGMTFAEQQKCIPAGFEIVHPAVILEAVLSHFKATGERLLETYWVRTSLLDSFGSRVSVGCCDAPGVDVGSLLDVEPYGDVGVGASRKFAKSLLLK